MARPTARKHWCQEPDRERRAHWEAEKKWVAGNQRGEVSRKARIQYFKKQRGQRWQSLLRGCLGCKQRYDHGIKQDQAHEGHEQEQLQWNHSERGQMLVASTFSTQGKEAKQRRKLLSLVPIIAHLIEDSYHVWSLRIFIFWLAPPTRLVRQSEPLPTETQVSDAGSPSSLAGRPDMWPGSVPYKKKLGWSTEQPSHPSSTALVQLGAKFTCSKLGEWKIDHLSWKTNYSVACNSVYLGK